MSDSHGTTSAADAAVDGEMLPPLLVATAGGRTLVLDDDYGLTRGDSGRELQERIASVTGLPIDSFHLSHGGRPLVASSSLAHLAAESTVHVSLRLLGGAPKKKRDDDDDESEDDEEPSKKKRKTDDHESAHLDSSILDVNFGCATPTDFATASIAQRLHADALCSILAFLSADEMALAVGTCGAWRRICVSAPPLRLAHRVSTEQFDDSSTAALASLACSRLRHHVSRVGPADGETLEIDMADMPLLNALPHLTALEVTVDFYCDRIGINKDDEEEEADEELNEDDDEDPDGDTTKVKPYKHTLDFPRTLVELAIGIEQQDHGVEGECQMVIDSLPPLQNLTWLKIHMLDAEHLDGSPLAHLKNLTYLDIWSVNDPHTPLALRQLPNLRVLRSNKYGFDDMLHDNEDFFAAPHLFQKLEEVELADVWLTTTQFSQLIALPSLTVLEPGLLDVECWVDLPLMPQLRRLHIADSASPWKDIPSEQFDLLAASIRAMPNLERLTFALRATESDHLETFWNNLGAELTKKLRVVEKM